MADESDNLIESLFFSESQDERIRAQVALRFEDEEDIRKLFRGFTRYVQSVVASKQPPHPEWITPLQQLQFEFRPVQNVLIGWHAQGVPLIEILRGMIDDADQTLRVPSVLALGLGIVMWKDDQNIEPVIDTLRQDRDPFLRAAANLAWEYLPLAKLVAQKQPMDTSTQQRMEQYAAQVMSGIARPRS